MPSVVLPRGSQRPRICHVPEHVTSAGVEAIELARLAGLELDEWQQFVLASSLGERADGKWAAQTVGLTVARQNGKDSILEARELVGLFLLGERLINHTAHQQKTATSHFRRLLRLIEGVPEFERRVMSAPRGKGSEAIELRGGQVIFFATRQGGGGRGLTGDVQIYNEAMYLSEQDRSSLAPTMAARSMHGNIQTWYVGSAVDQQDPTMDGVPFAQVRESGIAGKDGVAYFEWSAPGDDPDAVPPEVASDPAVWAMGNPGLGIRISHEWVEHERTVEMGARGFAVERLGIGDWPLADGTAGQKITVAQWTACLDAESAPVDPVVFAFDVTPDRRYGCIAVAGRRDDGLAHLEVVELREGTGWIIDRLLELVGRHDTAAVVFSNAGPAASIAADVDEAEGDLEARLKCLRVELKPAMAQDEAKACGGMQDAVVDRTARHRGAMEVTQALRGAATRPLGDAWAWARRTSRSNISPLVACTLAHWGLQTIPRRSRVRVVSLADALDD